MLNIVIPMAGRGSRFVNAGYVLPKPLIPVHGVPMIRLVIENLRPSCDHRFIFICQRGHVAEHDLHGQLSRWTSGCALIELDGITEGAACTALTARDMIDSEDPLMIANRDQYVDAAIDPYLDFMETSRLDGLIMTMQANDPKWSFAGLNQNGLVERVVEKEPISTHATLGFYNLHPGRHYRPATPAMTPPHSRD